MFDRQHLLGAMLALATAATALADTSPRYRNDDWHYDFAVPAGWVAIPDSALKDRGFDPGTADLRAPAPVAGFQAPHASWFHVPAVIITHLPGPAQRPKQVREELVREAEIGRDRAVPTP